MSTTASPTSPTATRTEQVWRALDRASFAVVSHSSAGGEPRSSGVVYAIHDRSMYVAVATDSWKARHIAARGRVAVTVPVRRGGLLSLLFPIPPATVSFHGSALVHATTSPEGRAALARLAHLLPPERAQDRKASILQIRPEGWFVTYGIGVPLMRMRDPAASRARVPVA